jgi:hypothetical protein
MQAGFANSDLAWDARNIVVAKLRLEAGLGSEPSGDDDSVTATLENGEQVELYGDAVDVAKPKPEASPALAAAISEIINNPATPADLYNSVADFVTDLRSGPPDNSPRAIHSLLTKEVSHAAN